MSVFVTGKNPAGTASVSGILKLFRGYVETSDLNAREYAQDWIERDLIATERVLAERPDAEQFHARLVLGKLAAFVRYEKSRRYITTSGSRQLFADCVLDRLTGLATYQPLHGRFEDAVNRLNRGERIEGLKWVKHSTGPISRGGLL